MSLNDLGPSALKAAMTTGTADWGHHGSLAEHALYVEPQDPTRRLCCCGCRKRVTHRLMANGVCMSQGCELRMRRILKAVAGSSAPAPDAGQAEKGGD